MNPLALRLTRRKLITASAAALVASACSRQDDAAPPPPAELSYEKSIDDTFKGMTETWLAESARLSPINATRIGNHQYDGEIDDLSETGRQLVINSARTLLEPLKELDHSKLSRANQVDAQLLQNELERTLWTAQTLQDWAWDPMLYINLAGSAIYSLMARDYAPIEKRLEAVTTRLEALPDLFEQMRKNLVPARVPLIHAQTASKQNKGVVSILDEMVMPHVAKLPDAERIRLNAAAEAIRQAVEELQGWIDNTLVPNAKGDFRIGKDLYDAKLGFALNSPMSRDDIQQRARAELTQVRSQMYEIARSVLKDKAGHPPLPDAPDHDQQQAAIEAALQLAYDDRPQRGDVVDTAKADLAQATDFVRSKDLVTVPDQPVDVILMPEYERGVAVAYCDAPGPLDKGQKTFFAVSPIPDDWTDEQTTSFLREYNHRSIQVLTIHEAMPGHYLQLAHANQYPSVLRSVLSSGPFVEGWAVYCERLMADQGYLDHDPLFKLVQLKWYLRTIANAILDPAIHVDGMSQDDAMKLMTVETFQQEREAAGKGVRAQLTSAQLPTYFVGVQEHLDMRAEAEKRWGKDFALKKYHDTALSFGSPPVRFVRELMFDEAIQ